MGGGTSGLSLEGTLVRMTTIKIIQKPLVLEMGGLPFSWLYEESTASTCLQKIKMDSVESAVHALVALHGYVMDPTRLL